MRSRVSVFHSIHKEQINGPLSYMPWQRRHRAEEPTNKLALARAATCVVGGINKEGSCRRPPPPPPPTRCPRREMGRANGVRAKLTLTLVPAPSDAPSPLSAEGARRWCGYEKRSDGPWAIWYRDDVGFYTFEALKMFPSMNGSGQRANQVSGGRHLMWRPTHACLFGVSIHWH